MSLTDREDLVAAIQHYHIPSFKFESGDVLDIKVAYASLNPSSAKKALIPTCYGGRIGTTCTFSAGDSSSLSSHHVIVVAMLGNGESSSPSNTPGFPKSLDYRDQIRAQHALLTQHLGISALDAVVGFSMGGQQAYYWAAMYPDFMRAAVCICGSARTSPHNYAFLEGPVAALTRSFDYTAEGGYPDAYKTTGKKPVVGLRGFGRAYTAWLYSADWFREGLWRKLTGARTMAEFMDGADRSWLDWDPEDVLILGRQWQNADVGVVGGGFEETLRGIKAKMLVMPGRTDQYFPPADSEVEMKYLTNAKLDIIPSVWGHAAGGGMNPEDNEFINDKIKALLSTD